MRNPIVGSVFFELVSFDQDGVDSLFHQVLQIIIPAKLDRKLLPNRKHVFV